MFALQSRLLGVHGAEACLDAFGEGIFCVCWKAKEPETLNRLSCLEQNQQGGTHWTNRGGESGIATVTAELLGAG